MGIHDFMFLKMLQIITDYNMYPQCIMLSIGYSTKAGWNSVGVGEWTCTIVTGYNHTNASHSKITDEEQVDVLIVSQSWEVDKSWLGLHKANEVKVDSGFFFLIWQPRYLEPVDKCSQYVCVNTAWMLYNLSRNCPKDVQKPDCGFRGMPVQVNTDSCCPEWQCPCKSLFYVHLKYGALICECQVIS